MILSVIVVSVLLFFVYFMIAVFTGAPFLPTGKKYVEEMVDLAALQPNERFVDLGSGDGRLVIAAAQRGANAVGYEINPFLVAIARFRIWYSGVGDRATIRWQSFWSADFRAADVISIFGITGIMPRLEKKLSVELRPGARVVSYIFSLPNWKPLVHQHGIRVYRR
ncbi:MAG: 50S ribosomal protein L11 methyltransferase [bacterium]|nr:50S ribosomal protein L11 methyltransferase [bacterium]